MTTYIKSRNLDKTIAAIDLGSNALRVIIAKVQGPSLIILKNIREPLRLGEDVFRHGRITPSKLIQAEEAFIRVFHHLMDYKVSEVIAVGTSALRDAKNSLSFKKKIYQSTGIELVEISGLKEAQLITKAITCVHPLEATALLMDIGGGSTELTVLHNNKISLTESFAMGTVRILEQSESEREKKLEEFKHKLEKFKNKSRLSFSQFVGTGGNLRRIGKLRKKLLNKKSSYEITFNELEELKNKLISLKSQDQWDVLDFDKNKSEVILPAINIILTVMNFFQLRSLDLPPVGLKEGLLLGMYPKKSIQGYH